MPRGRTRTRYGARGRRAWAGDWAAAGYAAGRAGDDVLADFALTRAEAVRRRRVAGLLVDGGIGTDMDAGLRLRALAEAQADALAGLLTATLRGEIENRTVVVLELIGERADPAVWCAEVHSLLGRLDPRGQAPQPLLWSRCSAFLLRHRYRPALVAAGLAAAGEQSLAEAALLALEHTPAAARDLFRRALRSRVPNTRCVAAAALALVDRDWGRAELLAVLAESDEQEPTAECRAALAESRDPAVRQAVLDWERRNPHEPERGPWVTTGEVMLSRAAEWLRYEMEKLRERVRPLAGRDVR